MRANEASTSAYWPRFLGPAALRSADLPGLESLLARPARRPDIGPARALVAGHRVLVTGAGGSIGTALCEQIAGLGPSQLQMLDRHENGLHAVAELLSDTYPALDTRPLLADVTDPGRLDTLFRTHLPHLVFHAAAYKHVPLMEANPCEAIRNNVTGSRLVCETAIRHGADRFVLVSTDKAVNPVSVMGASKHIAELVVGAAAGQARTAVNVVRFGNVLASSGSVIPRFIDQIRGGGPVTVTDRNVRRYFMLISEAIQLMLQAAAVNDSGRVYVLDMGEQVSVLELARDLIRLLGFEPERQIGIRFVGLRPGEKLSEQLVGDDEVVEPSKVPGVLQVRRRPHAACLPDGGAIAEMERWAAQGRDGAVVGRLQALIPGFRGNAELAAVS